ncbi:glycosyltransferase [Paracoccus sp. (in: a-proteobacteria)]|uniref:glycosyltransferase n=1 Tax=Paracoccus sp. TaxID=267 RepID=UPI0026DFBA39|nr:glycosyltransferase [Paracoccus sp. (in: a-proteobacteria)]MDO5647477.1 glycosyltransferase [Paracoccus sp. (in: a-proteobacteria)]
MTLDYHDLFDADFYAARYGVQGDALAHFVARGDRMGHDPCPYFSTSFYKARYPNWAAQGARTAVEDFLIRTDQGQIRQPHPLIDPGFYVGHHPDLADLGAQAALHFIRHGDQELRRPSAGFDAAFYARCYLPLGTTHPFRHYVVTGQGVPRPCARGDYGALGLNAPDRVVIAIHDMQAAGVPMLALNLAREWARDGWRPLFMTQRAGPLFPHFQDIGPVAVLAEGWDIAAIAARLPGDVPVVLGTAVVADLAQHLGGRACVLCLHEMRDYAVAQGLLDPLRDAQAEGVQIIASFPRMAAAYAGDLGPLPVLRPGLTPAVIDRGRVRALRRRFAGRPVFISAGHADYRKGFDLFLAAAWAIRDPLPDAAFIWLGARDGWAQGLADEAMKRGLHLILPGFVDDAAAWYRVADVYLLTSRQDAGPTTAMQAAQVGTPFVGYAADIGLIGQAESVGQFIAPGDQAGFVAAAVASVGAGVGRRRQIRRFIASEASFAAYARAVMARLRPHPTDD